MSNPRHRPIIAELMDQAPELMVLLTQPVTIKRVKTGIRFIPRGKGAPVLQRWNNGVISLEYKDTDVSVPDAEDFLLYFESKKKFHDAWKKHFGRGRTPKGTPLFGFVRVIRKAKKSRSRENPAPRFSSRQAENMSYLHEQGFSLAEIASRFDTSASVVRETLLRHGLETKKRPRAQDPYEALRRQLLGSKERG